MSGAGCGAKKSSPIVLAISSREGSNTQKRAARTKRQCRKSSSTAPWLHTMAGQKQPAHLIAEERFVIIADDVSLRGTRQAHTKSGRLVCVCVETARALTNTKHAKTDIGASRKAVKRNSGVGARDGCLNTHRCSFLQFV
jgi:hypothetical protein